jgi:arsenate reductase-like glutaredoxin family protein
MTKKDIIKEFISDDYGALSHKTPSNIDPKTTSHVTSDKLMRMVAQPSIVFTNYRRYYGESILPYNEIADKCKDDPKKFYNFLKKHKAESTFEEYFHEKTADNTLKEIAKQKAIDIIEDIITKKQIYQDVFNRDDNRPTIDEVKDKNKLIFGQLDKIVEYCKHNLSDAEKKLILSYINENII